MIYLDNAATTRIKDNVIQAITETMKNTWGNPSSVYDIGLEAKRLLEYSRKSIADYIGAEPDEIIFTSGACESNALALNICNHHSHRLIISEIEHKSIDSNPNVEYRVKVYNTGLLDLEDLQQVCIQTNAYHQTPFVSIQWANGEIGSVQNIPNIADLVHSYKGLLHTDATQLIADRPINVKKANIDLLSFSGQKLGAPKGVGVLYIKRGVTVLPIIYGSQERGIRGGTENLPYIVGLSTALNTHEYVPLPVFRYFINSIKNNFDFAYINADNELCDRLRSIISVAFNGYSANEILTLLSNDKVKIYASAGAACENHSNAPSRVLKAVGLTDEQASSTIRFSLCETTTINEIDSVIKALHDVFNVLNTL